MRKLKKVVSLTVVTAIMAASLDMGNVMAAETSAVGNVEAVESEAIQSEASDFQINEDGVLVKYLGDGGDVIIPDGVKVIGEGVFSGCENLAKLELPGSVTKIEANAFYGCSNLDNIEIPDSVTEIGFWAFDGTKWLEDKRAENPLVVVNNILIDGKTCSGDVIIPDGITEIGEGAFEEGWNLVKVEIPDSVTKIKELAFDGCSKLNSIEIPNSVVEIGANAFRGTKWLENKQAENPLVVVNNILIDGKACSGDVIIPDGITEIGENAFAGCNNLSSIEIPASVTKIGGYAFDIVSSLRSIEIPASVTEIGENVFGYTYTRYIMMICTRGSYAEAYAEKNDILYKDASEEITDFQIENGILVAYLGNGGDVIIPDGVKNIGERAFGGCSNLSSIKIPNGVTSIGDYAFRGCTSLSSIEIPDSVTEIGDRTFSECSNLSSIEIPDSVTEIGARAFTGTRWLQNKKTENPLVIVNNIVIDGWGCTGDVVLPEGVTSIAVGAFAEHSNMNTIAIPDSVTKIGQDAFAMLNVTICCSKGSYAETYAGKNGIPYQYINGDSNRVTPTGPIPTTIPIPDAEPSPTAEPTPDAEVSPTAEPTSSVVPSPTTEPTVSPSKVPQKAQKITAKDITKTYGDKAFSIGAKTDGKGKLSYKSGNKKVVTVSENGKVTIKGYGKTTITIKATETEEYKAAEKKIAITVKPKKQKAASLESTKAKTITVKWKKDTKASGYILQYSTDKKFKKNVKSITVTSNKTTSKKISKLKAGKKYYVRVCSYKKSSGEKIQGSYSVVKSIKVKK